jgi:hypothetical protein
MENSISPLLTVAVCPDVNVERKAADVFNRGGSKGVVSVQGGVRFGSGSYRIE